MSVGIVSANGVDDIDAVFEELLRGHFEWGVAFLYETAGDTIFDVGELQMKLADI